MPVAKKGSERWPLWAGIDRGHEAEADVRKLYEELRLGGHKAAHVCWCRAGGQVAECAVSHAMRAEVCRL